MDEQANESAESTVGVTTDVAETAVGAARATDAERIAERAGGARRNGGATAALAMCEAALAGAPNDVSSAPLWREKAAALDALKRYDDALAAMERALTLAPDDARNWVWKANVLLDSGQIDAAMTTLERAFSLDENLAMAWNAKGKILAALECHDEALAAFERAQSIDPDDWIVVANVGNTLTELGRYDEAVGAFESVIALDPDDPEAWYNKAAILNDLLQLDSALEAVDQGLAHCQSDAKLRKELLEFKWYLLDQLERYEEELATLTTLLELAPEHAGALSDYALVLYRLRQPQDALLYAERSLTLNPSNALTWRTQGLILEMLDRDEAALDAYTESLRLDDTDAFVWAQKADALRRLDRTDEALPTIETALHLNDSDDSAWRIMGLILRSLKRDDEALAAFTRALELGPTNTASAQERAAALYRLTRYDEALPAYERAIELGPTDRFMWHFKGRTLAFLNCHEEAVVAYDQALALNPGYWDALNLKATSLLALNRYEDTLKVYERMAELQPQNADVVRGEATCLRNLKRYEEALSYADRAQAMPGGKQNPNRWAEKVYALFALKRFDDATRAYDEAIATIPALATSGDLRLFVAQTLRRAIPDQRLRLKDGRWLGYLDYGDPDGAPIMYFHGLPGSRLGYIFDETLLQQLHIRIIAPDRPGIGLSDFQRRRRILDWPNDVIELADHLGLNRFAVVSVSGGGAYAAACAYAIPLRLTKVGLVSSASPGARQSGPGMPGQRYSNRYSFIVNRLSPWLLTRAINEILARLVMDDPEMTWRAQSGRLNAKPVAEEAFLPPVDREAFTEPYRHKARGLAWDARLAARPWGFRLQDIHASVFLWHGEQDVAAPVSMGRYLAKTIPNCQATFYPGEGHDLFTHHLEDILAALA